MNYIKIPQVKGYKSIPTEHIIRIEAASNYSKIYLQDNRFPFTVAKVLSWFQERLPEEVFIRTHNSHLINSFFIDQVEGRNPKSVMLKSGESILISRRKKKDILKILSKKSCTD